MNTIRPFVFLLVASLTHFSAAAENHILLIPYAPSMHLSTADVDISMSTGIEIGELREKFRNGILRSLNSAMTGDRQLEVLQSDHVIAADGTDQVLYKSIFYQQDTIWPMKYKGLDSLLKKKISYTIKNKLRPFEKSYMNIGFHDQRLLGELAESYGADTFLFLNEFEIKDNVKDCMDVEGQVHDREVRIHYSVFDREGKQLYGDVSVAHVWSNVNDAEEIMRSTYPSITAYILSSIPAR
ncbi:MAG: hypothetical protein RL213_1921 [Bacteroidota bacterium]|jgi:hypothetical protein